MAGPNQVGSIAVTKLSSSDVVVVDNGGAVLTTANMGQIFASGAAASAVVAATASVTLTNSTPFLAFHSTATITTFTVTLPATPVQGEFAGFSVDHAVTTLLVTASATTSAVANAPTSAAAGAAFSWFYDVTQATWYRRQ